MADTLSVAALTLPLFAGLSLLTMNTPASPQTKEPKSPKNLRSWGVALFMVALMALIAWLFVSSYRSNRPAAPYVSDSSLRQYTVAGESLVVPGNIVQQTSALNEKTVNTLSLTLLWPNLHGFTEETKEVFLSKAGEAALIFATVEKRTNSVDMIGRLESVYVPLFDGKPLPGPSGITYQPLKKSVGYDDERIAIYAGDDGVWAARCHIEGAVTAPTCLRDFHFGADLVLRYRFSITLLKDWRPIEKAMREAARNWAAN